MVLVVLLLVVAARMWATANRLDRLHVRTEAAWTAVETALARRIAVARTGAVTGAYAAGDAERVRALSAAADSATRAARADAENDLTRTLADCSVPPGDLAAELSDAGERIGLARRFYNDAVRDTRALRDVRFTRWFRLAGHAELPDYFEIADPVVRPPQRRTAARVVLLDPAERTLLFGSRTPEGLQVWFTPGGGVEAGEDLPTAAVRELSEELGLRRSASELAGPLWRRVARFTYGGVRYEQTEFYFAATIPTGFAPDTSGFDAVERSAITDHRWFSAEQMRDSADTVYPLQLPDRLAEARAAIGGRGPATVIEID